MLILAVIMGAMVAGAVWAELGKREGFTERRSAQLSAACDELTELLAQGRSDKDIRDAFPSRDRGMRRHCPAAMDELAAVDARLQKKEARRSTRTVEPRDEIVEAPRSTRPKAKVPKEPVEGSESESEPGDFCSDQYDLIWEMYRDGEIPERDFEMMIREIEDSCIGY